MFHPTHPQNILISTYCFSEPTAVINPINYSMPVYAADILASLQNIFAHDIALKKEIKGLELDALKEFLTVLSKVCLSDFNQNLQSLFLWFPQDGVVIELLEEYSFLLLWV